MANVKQAARPGETQKPQAAAGAETAAAAPVASSDLMRELKVTGHMMALPAGLFCIVNETSLVPGKTPGLPGVRISPPPVGGQNVEIAGFRPDGWLGPDGDATLVRIRRGPAQVLVTIYQAPDEPDTAPKLQVRQLLVETGAAAAPNAG